MTDNDPTPVTVVLTIDARGLACPLPVLRLRKALTGRPSGVVVELLATDRAAARDVPAFCAGAGHRLVSTHDEDGMLRFVIRRA
ncbi:MAG: sulfurtransferase TusA family protein [Rhodospirillaceae bacterium]|nr:MAG: sulfurtransferase TusA family protein [Rhodospirillaceae bacterium]